MNVEDIYNGVTNIKDDIILEADTYEFKQNMKPLFWNLPRMASMAAAIVLLFGLAIVVKLKLGIGDKNQSQTDNVSKTVTITPSNQPIEYGGNAGLLIPVGITEIKMECKSTGEVIDLVENEKISLFCEKLKQVSGTAGNIDEDTEEYSYVVYCYNKNEICANFTFVSESIINESINGNISQVVTNGKNAAYEYLEKLFE